MLSEEEFERQMDALRDGFSELANSLIQTETPCCLEMEFDEHLHRFYCETHNMYVSEQDAAMTGWAYELMLAKAERMSGRPSSLEVREEMVKPLVTCRGKTGTKTHLAGDTCSNCNPAIPIAIVVVRKPAWLRRLIDWLFRRQR